MADNCGQLMESWSGRERRKTKSDKKEEGEAEKRRSTFQEAFKDRRQNLRPLDSSLLPHTAQ